MDADTAQGYLLNTEYIAHCKKSLFFAAAMIKKIDEAQLEELKSLTRWL